jgi:hypothetical protein
MLAVGQGMRDDAGKVPPGGIEERSYANQGRLVSERLPLSHDDPQHL